MQLTYQTYILHLNTPVYLRGNDVFFSSKHENCNTQEGVIEPSHVLHHQNFRQCPKLQKIFWVWFKSHPPPSIPLHVGHFFLIALPVWELEVTPDMWHVTRDTWHLTCDIWHMSRDTQGVVNIVSRFQVPSSNSLAFMMFWRIGGKGWLSELLN